MKKPIRILLFAVVLAGAGYAGWRLYTQSHSVPQGELRLYGNVDIREVMLGFRVPGRVAEVAREEGDTVHPGDILARLDDEPIRRELDEAKAKLGSAKAHLALMEAGYRPEEVAEARASLREREATFANAERLYKRQHELLGSHTASQQEHDNALAAMEEATARLKSAREQVVMMEAGYRKEDVDQARSEVASAEATIASVQVRLADTVLKSPSEGVVMTRSQESGSILPAGTSVLTLSLREPVWVRAYVHEAEMGKLRPGETAEIYTDSRPAQPYKGQVGFISPRAEFTPRNVETAELRTSLVYRLRIVVTNADEGLRQGMPVTVRLKLQ